MKIATIELSNNEVVQRWKDNEIVFSVSLGGLGPSYEQAIQNFLFDILTYLNDNKVDVKQLEDGNTYSLKYEEICNIVADTFKHNDLTGAIYSVAKATAYQFHKYGYHHIMKKAPRTRLIQVKRTNLQ